MDELESLERLAPRVDGEAARSVFDRRRARWRRRRRAGAAVAGVVVAVALAAGAAALVGDREEAGEPVVAGEGEASTTTSVAVDGEVSEECAALEVEGPLPEGSDGSVEVRAVSEPQTGVPDGDPVREVWIDWFDRCYLQLIGRGLTPTELDVFVDGYYLVTNGVPMLDPRGAVWPETAQDQLTGPLPDERLDVDEVALAYAREVLGWDDAVIDPLGGERSEDGRCEANVMVHRSSRPDVATLVQLYPAVGMRWWSVCAGPASQQGLHVTVEGATVTVEGAAGAPVGTATARVEVRYGDDQWAYGRLGEPIHLGVPPTTSGSVVVLYEDGPHEVIGHRAAAFPAGDVVVGDAPDRPSESLPIVVSQHGVLGWWDGSSWVELFDASAGLPYEPGDELTVVGLSQADSIVAGEPTPHEFCNTTIVDDSGVPGTMFAVRADWDVQPRPIELLDPAADLYRDAVADYLESVGIGGVPVHVVRVVRVDLDGDDVDEVLIDARHPEANTGVGMRAGWYSVVLLRRLTDGAVDSVPVVSRIIRQDIQEPSMSLHDTSVIADLNGDGVMEVGVYAEWFEGSEDHVYDVTAEPTVVLSSGYCGV